MTKLISRRLFLGSAAAGMMCSGALAAPPTASLRPVLRAGDFFKRAVPAADEIIRAQKLSGQVAFAVADVQTGAWLECANERLGTPPASVTKAITALYALDRLGPDHRFETMLAATGGIQNGEVQGDLLLIGGGDPTVTTDTLAEMAAALKAAGVIGVKGALKVFEGALPMARQIDTEQPDHVGYNPAISGLALNFNRVHFEWKRASGKYAVTMDGRTDKYRPDVTMAAVRIEDRSAPVFTYADLNGRDQWTVARGALGSGGARWLPVRRPGLYAGEVFATLAGAHGIRLGKPEVIAALPPHEVCVRQQSDTLLTILQDMLKYSTNLTAEMVGLAASLKGPDTVADLRGSAGAMNRWATEKLGMSAPALVDHSGLGDASKVTALDMTRALVATQGSLLRSIMKPFGFRDTRGRPVQEQQTRVDAKTGTLNFVSSLAGYITAQDGREMAFAIFAADEATRAGITRAERERPRGAQAWNTRAKRVQQALIERWDTLYGLVEDAG
jgi:D-alanyl-D-alanine carboxypeptidase/D-alanyl-D-alanine-endopeptidase (penicillin-binding protein 4)